MVESGVFMLMGSRNWREIDMAMAITTHKLTATRSSLS